VKEFECPSAVQIVLFVGQQNPVKQICAAASREGQGVFRTLRRAATSITLCYFDLFIPTMRKVGSEKKREKTLARR
jgi:hypothetical protein